MRSDALVKTLFTRDMFLIVRVKRYLLLFFGVLIVVFLSQPSNLLLAQTQPTNTSNPNIIPFTNQATSSYFSNPDQIFTQPSNSITNQIQGLIDPLGQITGCAGEVLPDYEGFRVSVYDTDSTGLELAGLTPLTKTELPDIPNNSVPRGIAPNVQNSNPYFLNNATNGTYNFLLDPNRNQLAINKSYILLVSPPQQSVYSQRRVKITVESQEGTKVTYRADSLDGLPLRASDNATTVASSVNIQDAERVGLILAVLNISTSVCQSQSIQITKSGDRASAQPGDTVIYRLTVRNLASANLKNITVFDALPQGFTLVKRSVRAAFDNNPVAVEINESSGNISLNLKDFTLPSSTNPNGTNQTSILNIVYGVTLTPDAIRGSGENSASVQAQRLDNNRIVQDGPAIYRIRVIPGLLSNAGTIVGRVFYDLNQDGYPQAGEKGVPNAVIFMDDGVQITTDENGLFSLANVIAGYRTGILDLTSIPGYTITPNPQFIGNRSLSRLVHLEPGGLVRMNFGVVPIIPIGEPK